MDEKMKEKIESWIYLKELPQKVEDFALSVDMVEDKETFVIFRYICMEKRREAVCFYNKTTGDFMLRRIYGLNEYNDIEFITPSLEKFEELLQEKLAITLQNMSSLTRGQVSMMVDGTGLLGYDFKDLLPEQLCDFFLYIKPSEPVAMINGSHIIIDYSDFSKDAQLVVYYNELKSEFYAEKKTRGIVQTTGCMDAKDINDLCKRLQELPQALKEFKDTL